MKRRSQLTLEAPVWTRIETMAKAESRSPMQQIAALVLEALATRDYSTGHWQPTMTAPINADQPDTKEEKP